VNAAAAVRRSAAGLLAVLATVSATEHSEHRERALDVAVIAIASTAQPQASDDAVEVARLGGRATTVQSDAVATSDCDGCDATASAVTVTYVDGARSARVDNVAHAWSSCVGCGATSVSVQVVVLRRALDLHANNRAFAANVACDGCTTTAVAYQLVVVAPGQRTFSRRALDELTRWARDQAAAVVGGPAQRLATPQSDAHGGLDELSAQAERALGHVRTVSGDVDTSTAPG
jgi:hypothetical protein